MNIEIVKRFEIEGLCESMVYTQTTETSVKSIVDMMRVYRPDGISYRERTTDDANGRPIWDAWYLEIENPENLASPLYTLYCEDKGDLTYLGYFLSKRMPTFEVKLARWARIRWVCVDGAEVRSYPDLPFTDTDPAEWV